MYTALFSTGMVQTKDHAIIKPRVNIHKNAEMLSVYFHILQAVTTVLCPAQRRFNFLKPI